MNAIRFVALVGAVLLTAAELLSLDYYTARLASAQASHDAVVTLIARR